MFKMAKRSYYIANGFKDDCLKLLNLFDQTNSIRFEPFCNVWKEMQFSFIFSGRQTYSELHEFCEEVIHIAKQFIFPPYTFKERIGGLYLLYGLYYKIPIKDTVKIRVTQEQWTHLMELHEQLKEGEHLDANFILCTLIHDEAFFNTIFDNEWGLEKYYRQKQLPSNTYTVMPSLLELAQEGHPLAEVNDLAKMYRQLTSSASKDSKSASSLKYFNTNFVQDILNDVRRLENNKIALLAGQSNEGEGSKSDGRKGGVPGRKEYNRVRPRIGDGFDMDTSDEEEEVFDPLENYDPNLPSSFNEDMEMEVEAEVDVKPKRPRIAEVALPSNSKIKEDLDLDFSDQE